MFIIIIIVIIFSVVPRQFQCLLDGNLLESTVRKICRLVKIISDRKCHKYALFGQGNCHFALRVIMMERSGLR